MYDRKKVIEASFYESLRYEIILRLLFTLIESVGSIPAMSIPHVKINNVRRGVFFSHACR